MPKKVYWKSMQIVKNLRKIREYENPKRIAFI